MVVDDPCGPGAGRGDPGIRPFGANATNAPTRAAIKAVAPAALAAGIFLRLDAGRLRLAGVSGTDSAEGDGAVPVIPPRRPDAKQRPRPRPSRSHGQLRLGPAPRSAAPATRPETPRSRLAQASAAPAANAATISALGSIPALRTLKATHHRDFLRVGHNPWIPAVGVVVPPRAGACRAPKQCLVVKPGARIEALSCWRGMIGALAGSRRGLSVGVHGGRRQGGWPWVMSCLSRSAANAVS